MPLAQLPASTIKLIGSSQVITSVTSVIKELMENSIDSGAHHIDIKLDKHGLDKIEIKDDGPGIRKSDAMVVCLPSYTSKISDFSDLDKLSSYGFRGEALSALCNVSQVSVTTKSADDEIASCYSYDHNGQVTCSKISHITKGTIVTVTGLFKNLPVRKQYMSNSKRAADELKKVEKIVKSLAMVHPRLRVSLVHNKFLIWQKTSVSNLRQSVMQVISVSIVKQLHHILYNTDQLRVEMLVPSRDCDVSSLCFSNFVDAYFLFINNRPIRNKEVEKTVYNKLFEYFGVYLPVNKYPVCVTSLSLPADCIDVNLEPNKTQVYLKNKDDVLDILKQCLHLYYGDQQKETEDNDLKGNTKPNKKRKVEDNNEESNAKKVVLEEFKSGFSEESGIEEESSSQSTIPVEKKSQISIDSPDKSATDQSSSGCEVGLSQQEIDDVFEKFCLEKETQVTTVNKPICNESISTEITSSTSLSNIHSPVHSVFFNLQNNQNPTGQNHCKPLKDVDLSSVLTTENNNKSNNPQPIMGLNSLSGLARKLSSDKSPSSENAKEFLVVPGRSDRKNPSLSDQTVNSDGSDYEVKIVDEQSRPVLNSCREVRDSPFGISSPSLSQWSRGEMTSSGASVKASSVLVHGQAASPQISQGNRSVSSQMGCKEMSAFTKFARKMRKQILNENPGMSFSRVAQQLQIQWRQLNEDEKKEYEETMVVKKVANPESKVKQTTLSNVKKLHRPPDIECEISLDSLKQMVKCSIEEEAEVQLIGRLESSPLWLYYTSRADIAVFSITRLLEAVKFHSHMASFALPVKLLDHSIPVKSTEIADSDWRLLLTLERSPNGVIKDPRLVNNGFIVEIIEDEPEARLTYVPQNIAYCGVEELQEILSLLQSHGSQASLSQCRPLKVISFIRSEVMRECSQEEPPTHPEQVLEHLSYWLNNVAAHSQLCIHHEPVNHSLNAT